MKFGFPGRKFVASSATWPIGLYILPGNEYFRSDSPTPGKGIYRTMLLPRYMDDATKYLATIVRKLQNHWVFRENDPYRLEGRYVELLTIERKGDAFPVEHPDDIWDDERDWANEILAFIELTEV